jgi:hypothetical protein
MSRFHEHRPQFWLQLLAWFLQKPCDKYTVDSTTIVTSINLSTVCMEDSACADNPCAAWTTGGSMHQGPAAVIVANLKAPPLSAKHAPHRCTTSRPTRLRSTQPWHQLVSQFRACSQRGVTWATPSCETSKAVVECGRQCVVCSAPPKC